MCNILMVHVLHVPSLSFLVLAIPPTIDQCPTKPRPLFFPVGRPRLAFIFILVPEILQHLLCNILFRFLGVWVVGDPDISAMLALHAMKPVSPHTTDAYHSMKVIASTHESNH